MFKKRNRGFSVVSKIRRTKLQSYTADWRTIADEVKRRDGHRCRDCGSTKGPFHVHHIIPVSRGGLTVKYNLKTLCDNCHSKKPFHKHMR